MIRLGLAYGGGAPVQLVHQIRYYQCFRHLSTQMENGGSFRDKSGAALVHLASGIGNIVLATPLIVALREMDFEVDLLVDGDYGQTDELFRDWSAIRKVIHQQAEVRRGQYSAIIPAIPPFYWPRFAPVYSSIKGVVSRPPETLFCQNEQEYYLAFARRLGYSSHHSPFYMLPIAPSGSFGVTSRTLVIAPGCKTGEMATKRWPYFGELAECFDDVLIVGTAEDLLRADGSGFRFPSHARNLAGRLSLRETAEAMAGAGAVVGNDSGLSHVAGASGAPTVMIFGPTPNLTLGRFPPNVVTVRAGLDCEPCWFGNRFHACAKRIDCLRAVSVKEVRQVVSELMGLD